MRGISLLCFILVIPIFAVLGHDAYMSYHSEDFTKPMMLSNVGWLWSNYLPDSFQWVQDNVSKETWLYRIVPLIKIKSVIVAAIPALVTFTILILLRIFNLPPFRDEVRGSKRNKTNFSFSDGQGKRGQIKYKRK